MPTSGHAKANLSIPINLKISFPYEIAFVDCEPSEAVRFQLEQQLARLNNLYKRIIDCKIAVRVHHKASKNRFYHLNIILDLPGKKIVASHDPETKSDHSEPSAAIRDAFHKLIRQLDDFLAIRKDHSRNLRVPEVILKIADGNIE